MWSFCFTNCIYVIIYIIEHHLMTVNPLNVLVTREEKCLAVIQTAKTATEQCL